MKQEPGVSLQGHTTLDSPTFLESLAPENIARVGEMMLPGVEHLDPGKVSLHHPPLAIFHLSPLCPHTTSGLLHI